MRCKNPYLLVTEWFCCFRVISRCWIWMISRDKSSGFLRERNRWLISIMPPGQQRKEGWHFQVHGFAIQNSKNRGKEKASKQESQHEIIHSGTETFHPLKVAGFCHIGVAVCFWGVMWTCSGLKRRHCGSHLFTTPVVKCEKKVMVKCKVYHVCFILCHWKGQLKLEEFKIASHTVPLYSKNRWNKLT